MARVIGHIDVDYFYAQVEEAENPSIRDRPVLVCVFSGRTEDSGVVSTANYKARESGVKSGMPIVLAKRKVEGKDPAIISMERGKYEVVSERIMQLVKEEVDLLEQTGIDEAFFDITNATKEDYTTARTLAEGIKKSILDNERLSCSVGIGRSKAVAKLGSDLAKPGGIMVITPESTAEFLKPIPVTKLYGVGPKTTDALVSLGVTTIGDLASADFFKLEGLLGRSLSAYLHAAATGLDSEPVTESQAPTQFMKIITLKKDTKDLGEIQDQLEGALTTLGTRLKSNNESFRTLTAIGILTDLTTRTKSKTYDVPINDLNAVRANVADLFEELADSVSRDFRRAGIRVSDLSSNKDQKSLAEFLQ